MDYKKTNNGPNDKVDFTLVSSLRENAMEGGELPEHRVDDKPAIDNAGDGEGVE